MTAHPPPADRQSLLALTPAIYLAKGFRQPDGSPWPELRTTWSLAAAEQLRTAGITPAQLDATLGPIARTALAGRGQSLDAARAELYGPVMAPGVAEPVRSFLGAVLAAVRTPEDLEPLAEHLGSVLQLVALGGVLGPRAS